MRLGQNYPEIKGYSDMPNKRARTRVPLSRVRSAIKMMTGAGKSLVMIALLPDQTVQLYAKRPDGGAARSVHEAEIERFLAGYGED